MTITDDNGIEREVVVRQDPEANPSSREALVLGLINDLGWNPEDAEAAVYEAMLEAEDDGKDLAAPEMTKSFANWIVGKIARANKRCADVDALAAEEIAAIQRRAADLKKPHLRAVEFFTQRYTLPLQEWASAELAGEKKRSIGLLHGTVGFRKSPDKVVFDVDEESAIITIEAFDDLKSCVKITKSLLTTPLKKYMVEHKMEHFSARPVADPDGVEFDLAHIEPGADKFYITTDTE